jgi:hypothetical protein
MWLPIVKLEPPQVTPEPAVVERWRGDAIGRVLLAIWEYGVAPVKIRKRFTLVIVGGA